MDNQINDFERKRKDVEIAFADYADSILKCYSDNPYQPVLKHAMGSAKMKWENAINEFETHFPLGTV